MKQFIISVIIIFIILEIVLLILGGIMSHPIILVALIGVAILYSMFNNKNK